MKNRVWQTLLVAVALVVWTLVGRRVAVVVTERSTPATLEPVSPPTLAPPDNRDRWIYDRGGRDPFVRPETGSTARPKPAVPTVPESRPNPSMSVAFKGVVDGIAILVVDGTIRMFEKGVADDQITVRRLYPDSARVSIVGRDTTLHLNGN